LGSTGSIGTQALEYISQHQEEYNVVALTAGNNLELLRKQIVEFEPEYVSVIQDRVAAQIKEEFNEIEIGQGESGLLRAIEQDADMVLIAISGIAALLPTIKAIELNRDIAIANKELLVAAGDLVVKLARERNVSLIPVDSEHSAIMQILFNEKRITGFINYEHHDVKNIVLTASGGAFRDIAADKLSDMSPEEALKHPTWSMGKKITIDSATMMNKGLEVIEAQKLFNIDLDRIKVLIHPQSYVHGLVEYHDGTVFAQMGPSDMKVPIAFALSQGRRTPSKEKYDLIDQICSSSLDFYLPDLDKYPALKLAYFAAAQQGTYPAVMNAANEETVSLFLEKKIKFTDITAYIDTVLQKHNTINDPDIDQVIAADQEARQAVKMIYQQKRN